MASAPFKSGGRGLILRHRCLSVCVRHTAGGEGSLKEHGLSAFKGPAHPHTASTRHFTSDSESVSNFSKVTASLPGKVKVVICGGGVVGCSVAFHLAKRGWTDVVVLEQGRYPHILLDYRVYNQRQYNMSVLCDACA